MILAAQLLIPFDAPPPDIAGLAPRRIRPIGVPAAGEYPAVLDAPIFSPDRRPASGGAPADTGDGGTLAGYAALGAVTGRGVATGVVSLPGGGVKTLRRGDAVGGWRLAGVDRTRLTFERDGARIALVIGAGALAPDTDAAGAIPGAGPFAGAPRP